MDELLKRYYVDFGLEPGFGLMGVEVYQVAIWSPNCRRSPRYFGRLCGHHIHEGGSPLVVDGGDVSLGEEWDGEATRAGVWRDWPTYLEHAIARLGLADAGVIGHEGCFHRRGKSLYIPMWRVALLLRTGGEASLPRSCPDDSGDMRSFPAAGVDFDEIPRLIRSHGQEIGGVSPRYVCVARGTEPWIAIRSDGWVGARSGTLDAGQLWRGGWSEERIATEVQRFARWGKGMLSPRSST